MTEIPQDAITAATEAIERELMSARFFDTHVESDEALARAALAAAAPLIVSHRETATAAAIAKAERERMLAAMPTITVQVADGGTISAEEWNALGDKLKALWQQIAREAP